jgi:hypothetical protein
LNKIPNKHCPNVPLIFGCYKNEIPSKMNYEIRVSKKNALNKEIQKAIEIEECMLETNVYPNIILGKLQRQMKSIALSSQGPSTSRNIEGQGVGGGGFSMQTP